MELKINTPDLNRIEIKAYLVMGQLNGRSLSDAKKQMAELIEMIKEEQDIKREWRDVLFSLANKM